MRDPVWTLRRGVFTPLPPERQGDTPSRFTLWGIVNVTPDSFFDGGRHETCAEALAHAVKLLADGARILDLGGASSRPGAADVPAEEEARRVLPLVRELAGRRGEDPGIPAETLLSVDTWRASVAEAALDAGADIINDISGCAWEPRLREIVSSFRPGYVLMHCLPGTTPGTMQRDPRYANVVDEVARFFESSMAALVRAGLPEENIILDPGIGFGKTAAHNASLLAGMERFQALGRPVLLGVSQKSLFGTLLGLETGERGEATSVCTALLAARGVSHHRVHDVAAARRALVLAEHFTPWRN